MNEIVNRFLLTGNKFIPEIHLKQLSVLEKLGFTDSACGPFTKNKEKNKKEAGDSWYIYQNKLGKACGGLWHALWRF